MSWIVPILTFILKLLIPAIFKAFEKKVIDADPQLALRKKLSDRVKEHWKLGTVFLLCFILVGCNPRTVYIPDGTPVRLRETVKDAKIWVKQKDGNIVPGKMDLPEGWYCLPVPE